METTSIMGMLDIIMLLAGVYVLYGWYLLQFKGEIKQGLLIPKDMDPGRCKDFEGFRKATSLPVLLTGLVALASGGIGLYQDYVAMLPAVLYWVSFVLFLGVLVWYMIVAKKAMKKYF